MISTSALANALLNVAFSLLLVLVSFPARHNCRGNWLTGASLRFLPSLNCASLRDLPQRIKSGKDHPCN